MTRTFPAFAVILVALAGTPAAEAGPIIYFDSYRSLDFNGTFFENTTTGDWFASASSDRASARQQTTIGLQLVDGAGHPFELIRGSGRLLSFPFEPVNTTTDLFTSFMLDSPYTADLDAFVSARDAGFAEGFLFDVTRQVMLAQAATENGTTRLSFNGVLEPGVYSYYLFAGLNTPGTFNDHNAQFGGEFALSAFTPVPEPATMTLLGLGLAAAWRRRRTT